MLRSQWCKPLYWSLSGLGRPIVVISTLDLKQKYFYFFCIYKGKCHARYDKKNYITEEFLGHNMKKLGFTVWNINFYAMGDIKWEFRSFSARPTKYTCLHQCIADIRGPTRRTRQQPTTIMSGCKATLYKQPKWLHTYNRRLIFT